MTNDQMRSFSTYTMFLIFICIEERFKEKKNTGAMEKL